MFFSQKQTAFEYSVQSVRRPVFIFLYKTILLHM